MDVDHVSTAGHGVYTNYSNGEPAQFGVITSSHRGDSTVTSLVSGNKLNSSHAIMSDNSANANASNCTTKLSIVNSTIGLLRDDGTPVDNSAAAAAAAVEAGARISSVETDTCHKNTLTSHSDVRVVPGSYAGNYVGNNIDKVVPTTSALCGGLHKVGRREIWSAKRSLLNSNKPPSSSATTPTVTAGTGPATTLTNSLASGPGSTTGGRPPSRASLDRSRNLNGNPKLNSRGPIAASRGEWAEEASRRVSRAGGSGSSGGNSNSNSTTNSNANNNVSRPGSAAVRPGTGTRPGSAAVRPGTGTRPGSAAVRPGTGTTRPGSARPGTTSTASRPGSRPGSRPESVLSTGSMAPSSLGGGDYQSRPGSTNTTTGNNLNNTKTASVDKSQRNNPSNNSSHEPNRAGTGIASHNSGKMGIASSKRSSHSSGNNTSSKEPSSKAASGKSSKVALPKVHPGNSIILANNPSQARGTRMRGANVGGSKTSSSKTSGKTSGRSTAGSGANVGSNRNKKSIDYQNPKTSSVKSANNPPGAGQKTRLLGSRDRATAAETSFGAPKDHVAGRKTASDGLCADEDDGTRMSLHQAELHQTVPQELERPPHEEQHSPVARTIDRNSTNDIPIDHNSSANFTATAEGGNVTVAASHPQSEVITSSLDARRAKFREGFRAFMKQNVDLVGLGPADYEDHMDDHMEAETGVNPDLQ